MNARAQISLLPDGRRLHLQDGPIDIVLQAFAGSKDEVRTAYRAAADRFTTVLDELCEELPLLRSPAGCAARKPNGTVARRMFSAVMPYAEEHFITPMAAVAGAVAEEILNAMTEAGKLARAYINNGGDIALHLAPGETFTIAMIDRPDRPSLLGTLTLDATQPVRGIATSGWRGRSFSRGIADAVTVLASRASSADAAATIIANAVDLPRHPQIFRARACDLTPDSDLGEIMVTTGVGKLTTSEIDEALSRGEGRARHLQASGLIYATALHLNGKTRVVMPPDALNMIAGCAERELSYA